MIAALLLVCAQEATFLERLQEARHVADGAEAARREAVLLWEGGDLPGALEAVREGLLAAPEDPVLARLATDVALAAGRTREAAHWMAVLEVALEAQPPTGDAAAWWEAQLGPLRAGLDEAEARQAATRGALWRARAVAVGGLVVLLGLLVGALRRG